MSIMTEREGKSCDASCCIRAAVEGVGADEAASDGPDGNCSDGGWGMARASGLLLGLLLAEGFAAPRLGLDGVDPPTRRRASKVRAKNPVLRALRSIGEAFAPVPLALAAPSEARLDDNELLRRDRRVGVLDALSSLLAELAAAVERVDPRGAGDPS
jgi:hypothetical protein